MGQSNVLLRIYYVKDFPLHTLLLEIRKGYFMEPENKFATAGRKRWRRRGRDEKKNKQKKADRTLQYQVVSKQWGRDLEGAGWISFKKNDCIPLFFLFSFLSFSFFPPCSLAMFQIRAWSFFRKCVVLMHFKSPFSKHNGKYRHRSLAVPLKKVAQSLRAVLHCAGA